MQADLETAYKGLKPCLTFYPTYDWELAFHIYREEVHWVIQMPHWVYVLGLITWAGGLAGLTRVTNIQFLDHKRFKTLKDLLDHKRHLRILLHLN